MGLPSFMFERKLFPSKNIQGWAAKLVSPHWVPQPATNSPPAPPSDQAKPQHTHQTYNVIIWACLLSCLKRNLFPKKNTQDLVAPQPHPAPLRLTNQPQILTIPYPPTGQRLSYFQKKIKSQATIQLPSLFLTKPPITIPQDNVI